MKNTCKSCNHNKNYNKKNNGCYNSNKQHYFCGTVVITISLGKEESQEEEIGFTLQNLSGYSESEATSYLENNGLRKETTSKYSDSIAAGYVIYTSPQSGSTVNSGDTISFTSCAITTPSA